MKVRLEHHMIPMRDGTRLATDVLLGKGDGPRPVIVARTPYGRAGLTAPPPVHLFCRAGYAVLVQDVRGRGGSEGVFTPMVNEPDDAADTGRWLIDQPWCDGRFAILGISYLAAAALGLAVEFPDRVRAAVWVTVPASSRLMWTGGVMRFHHTLPWTLLGRVTLADYDWASIYGRLPAGRAVSSLGISTPLWDEIAAAAGPDDARLRSGDLTPLLARVRVPGLHFGGWYDFILDLSLDPYRRLAASGAPQRLILGPWSHNGVVAGRTGTQLLDYGPAASSRFFEEVMRWLCLWIRPETDGVAGAAGGPPPVAGDTAVGPAAASSTGPPVKAFVSDGFTGRGRWVETTAWPPPEGRSRRLYLSGTGSLGHDSGPAGERAYTYDPLHPAPTEGGAVWEFPAGGLEPGPAVQTSAARADVLTWDTAPLAAPLTLCGPVRASLFVSTSAQDTDFTAKLCDVDAEGVSRIITDGVIRARYREGDVRPTPVTPGSVFEVTVDLQACGHRFPAGHRLRLEVSSSNFPKYLRNLNTLENPLWEERPITARQVVYSGEDRPSRLEVWELPSES